MVRSHKICLCLHGVLAKSWVRWVSMKMLWKLNLPLKSEALIHSKRRLVGMHRGHFDSFCLHSIIVESVFVTTLLGFMDPFPFFSWPPSPSRHLSGFGFLHGDSLPRQWEHRGLAPTSGVKNPLGKISGVSNSERLNDEKFRGDFWTKVASQTTVASRQVYRSVGSSTSSSEPPVRGKWWVGGFGS